MNRVAGGILQLFNQADRIAPTRGRESDGAFPSPEHHQQNPGSDHEPHQVAWTTDLVCTAGDYTHDPARGFDADKVAEQLRLSRDPRIKYVIRRQRMFSSYPAHSVPAWTWRDYAGTYHGDHVHVSLVDGLICNNRTPWRIDMTLELDADPDFTALKYRMDAAVQMADSVDLHVKGPDGKERVETNRLAQELRGITESLRLLSLAVSSLTVQVQEIRTILAATPDHEPSEVNVETVKLGVQAAFADGFPPHAVS